MDQLSYEDRRTIRFFQKHRKLFLGIGILVLFFGLSVASHVVYDKFNLGVLGDSSDISTNNSDDMENSDCSIVGINLHGEVMTYIPKHAEGDADFNYDSVSSEDILWTINQANEDPNVKAIVIEVDSGGGSPIAGEEISNAIEKNEKPVIAFIRQTGASAAYWAISGADKIFASKNSDIGSIGVTMSYMQDVNKNKKDGYEYIPLTTGKFKDTGNPSKPITDEEKILLMRDLKIIYENFIESISKNRQIPLEKVRQIADGSTMLGQRAKEVGLIDEIGGISEVEKYLEETLGEKSYICWK